MAVNLAYSVFKPSALNGLRSKVKAPIVIMHAVFGQRKEWTTIAQEISENTQRKVFTVDARNHGESPRCDQGNYTQMANDLEVFLKEKKIEHCHILGHSLGGRTGMAFALKNPKSVKSLTVLDISPVSLPDKLIEVVLSLAEYLRIKMPSFHFGVTEDEAKKVCEQELEIKKVPSMLREMLISNIVKKENTFSSLVNINFLINRTLSDLVPFPNFESNFPGPVRFMCSEKPIFVRKEDHSQIRRLFPKADINYIEGRSHYLYKEDPKTTISEFTKFVFTHDATSNL